MKKLTAILTGVILMLLPCTVRAAETVTPALTVVQANGILSWERQKTASFPDWKNYTDDTLAMNSMISFQGYHGQGQLMLDVYPWFRRRRHLCDQSGRNTDDRTGQRTEFRRCHADQAQFLP